MLDGGASQIAGEEKCQCRADRCPDEDKECASPESEDRTGGEGQQRARNEGDGREHVRDDENYLILANHPSLIDVVFLLLIFH